MAPASDARRITTNTLQTMKQDGEKIAMLTAYDYSLARLVDGAGVDVILVGDSASNVMAGNETTIPITLDQMIYHASGVVKGAQRALVVVDLPFGTYQGDSKTALESSIRIMKESGAHAVKLEGGAEVGESVERILTAGIPVMGHIGLTPQSVNQLGGYKVQGKTPKAAAQLLRDAQALEEAGAFSVVLETVPAPLGRLISQRLSIPTIGIGAGVHCDGQVQVVHDMLGLFTDFLPKHAKRYALLAEATSEALGRYAQEVREGVFPTEKESFSMDESVLGELTATLVEG